MLKYVLMRETRTNAIHNLLFSRVYIIFASILLGKVSHTNKLESEWESTEGSGIHGMMKNWLITEIRLAI